MPGQLCLSVTFALATDLPRVKVAEEAGRCKPAVSPTGQPHGLELFLNKHLWRARTASQGEPAFLRRGYCYQATPHLHGLGTAAIASAQQNDAGYYRRMWMVRQTTAEDHLVGNLTPGRTCRHQFYIFTYRFFWFCFRACWFFLTCFWNFGGNVGVCVITMPHCDNK